MAKAKKPAAATKKPAAPKKKATAAGLSAASVEAALQVKLPQRYRDFLDGGEYQKHNGRFVSEVPGLAGRRQVLFDAPKLLTVFGVHGVKIAKIIPLAALKDNPELLTLDVSDPACPVGLWDEGAFVKFLPSLDALLAELVDKGEQSPTERLIAATKEAQELRKADKEAKAIVVLDKAIGDLSPATARQAVRKQLGLALNVKAGALLFLDRSDEGLATYELSVACGGNSGNYALLNICGHHLKKKLPLSSSPPPSGCTASTRSRTSTPTSGACSTVPSATCSPAPRRAPTRCWPS